MRFVKKAAMWVGYLALGCLLSYAQDVKSQDVLTGKTTVPSDIAQQIAQIGKAATVILTVETTDGKVGNGSGFFVREDLIVTNIHVVAGIYGEFFSCSAKLVDQPTHYRIKGVMASDPDRDLVILRVEGSGAGVLQLGDSDTVKLGEEVIAIGTPKGVSSKIVKGTISRMTADFFRVKATLPSGYSGGAVLNNAGEVIGICVEGGETKTLSTVIPSNHLKTLLKDIPTQEKSLEKWRSEPLIRAYAIVKQGDERMAFGNVKGAIEAYNTAIRLKPDFVVAYARRADAKYNLRDYKGMLKDFDVSIRLGLDYANAYVNRGVAKRSLRDYKGAIKDCDTAIRLDPENVEAYFNRGNANSDLGNHKIAIEDYSTAIRLKPRDVILAVAYFKRAKARSKLDDNIGAIEDYTKAIRLKSDNAAILTVAYLNRGLVKFGLGDAESAIEDYNEVIQLKPQDAMLTEVYVHRATAKAKLGDNISAIKDYSTAIHLADKNTDFAAHVYGRRASAKLEIGDNRGAIEDSDAAVRLDPNLAEAYKIRGDAKSNLGNHNTAIIDYDIAIDLKPDDAEAYYKRGSAKLEIGDVSEAKIDFRTALKLAESEDTQSLKDNIEKSLHFLK